MLRNYIMFIIVNSQNENNILSIWKRTFSLLNIIHQFVCASETVEFIYKNGCFGWFVN